MHIIFHIGQTSFIHHAPLRAFSENAQRFMRLNIFRNAPKINDTVTLTIAGVQVAMSEALACDPTIGAIFSVARSNQQTITAHVCEDDEVQMLLAAALDRQQTKVQAMRFEYSMQKKERDENLIIEERHVNRLRALLDREDSPV